MTDLPADPIDAALFLRQSETNAAWKAVLTDPQGRRVVWDILEQCGLFQSTFTGNASAAFLEGKRQIGLWLLGDRLNPHSPSVFAEMMMEAARFEDHIAQLKKSQEDNDD